MPRKNCIIAIMICALVVVLFFWQIAFPMGLTDAIPEELDRVTSTGGEISIRVIRQNHKGRCLVTCEGFSVDRIIEAEVIPLEDGSVIVVFR